MLRKQYICLYKETNRVINKYWHFVVVVRKVQDTIECELCKLLIQKIEDGLAKNATVVSSKNTKTHPSNIQIILSRKIPLHDLSDGT